MNKQRTLGIGWCDFSWSPLSGCLGPDSKGPCNYCYARKIAERFGGTRAFPNGFAPTWHPERLMEPLRVKKPSRIFASSMCDPFGDWVEPNWLDAMFAIMRLARQHRFLLLTKRPQNIAKKLWQHEAFQGNDPLQNVWLGCTLTGAKGEKDPSSSMCELQDEGWHVFVSIEPLLGPVPDWYAWAEWVILGALTPGKHEPAEEWVESVFAATCATGTPLFIKKNLRRYNLDYDCQCYPSGLKVHNSFSILSSDRGSATSVTL